MFCSNINAFLFVEIVAFVIVGSQAAYLRTVKKTYSCGNNEFQHEEGSSGKWEKKEITYFIESFGTSMSAEDVRNGIQSAFSHWAGMVDLTFTKVDERDAADIVLGFESGEHGDNFPFNNGYFAENVKMAHCIGKMPCTLIHFDDDLHWRFVDGGGKWLDHRRVGEVLDFQTVAMHQIGHALGLEHIGDDGTRHAHADEESVNVMDKIYTRPAGRSDYYAWPRPRTGDVRAIKALYPKVEDFEEMKKDCHGYWNQHEYATYNNLTGKYIILQKGAENFLAAQDYCQQIGGSLVSIHSEEENQFITGQLFFSSKKPDCLDFIRSKFSDGREAYIGLVRDEANSSWIWEDGQSLTYQNWNPGEPNGRGVENSVEILATGERGGWNDIQNDRAKTAVCQVQCPIEFKTEAQALIGEPQQEDSKIFFFFFFFFTNILETFALYRFLCILLAILFILSVIFISFLILKKRNSNKKRFDKLDDQKLIHT